MANTLRAIFPGEEHALGFKYFEEAGARPFLAAGGAGGEPPSWNKAWWCAQLALLAYTRDEAKVRQCLALGGLQGDPHQEASAQYLLAHDGKGNAWVAFRGTEIVAPTDFTSLGNAFARWKVSAGDWRQDLDAATQPWAGGASKVHRGFFDAYAGVKDKLHGQIDALAPRTLWFCGHSLGGALATLAAADFGARASGVYTFGSPLVGDASFATAMAVPHARLVNGSDGVPLVPPAFWGFRHHTDGVNLPVDSVVDLFASLGIRNEGFFATAENLATVAVPPPAMHHTPLLYVAQCQERLGQAWG